MIKLKLRKKPKLNLKPKLKLNLKPKKLYQVVTLSDSLITVHGNPIILKNYEHFSFFSYRTKQGKFAIHEKFSGYHIGKQQNSLSDAKKSAQSSLKMFIGKNYDKLQSTINARRLI